MREIIKMSVKLLFRNVGFWLCLIVLPILATVIMSIKQQNLSYYYLDNDDMGVLEIEDYGEKVAYYAGDGKFVVKVYDACGNDLSEYLLGQLARTGMFKLGRMKVSDKAEADEYVLSDGQNDRMGAALFISPEFGSSPESFAKLGDAVTAYVMSEDERFEIFKNKIETILQRIEYKYILMGSTDIAGIVNALEAEDALLPAKKTQSVIGKTGNGLTKEQIDMKTNIGYAFAFLTLSFVLIGNLVAQGVIKEQNNDVLKRIKLTGQTSVTYFASKVIICVIVSLLIALVTLVCTFFLDAESMGVGRITLTAMVFLMGLIFCCLSLVAGTIAGNVMSANITSFTIWCMSCMLSGLYFPMNGTSKTVQAISAVMPQKWFMDGIEKIFLGDKSAWLMLLCVTAAYIILFIGFGSVGIRMRSSED